MRKLIRLQRIQFRLEISVKVLAFFRAAAYDIRPEYSTEEEREGRDDRAE